MCRPAVSGIFIRDRTSSASHKPLQNHTTTFACMDRATTYAKQSVCRERDQSAQTTNPPSTNRFPSRRYGSSSSFATLSSKKKRPLSKTSFSSAAERIGVLFGKHLDKQHIFHVGQEELRTFWKSSSTRTFFTSVVEGSGVPFEKYLDQKDNFHVCQKE